MKSSRALLVLAVILAAAAGCGRNEKSGSDRQGSEGTSATEIFDLRSRCAELAQKLLDGGVHGPSVQAGQKSSYSPANNRCYVELDFSTADASSPEHQSTRYLYDGQTKQVLAWYRVDRDGDNAEKTNCSISDNTSMWVPDSTDCEAVNAKITEMMADDR
jgi:hypothetical protein